MYCLKKKTADRKKNCGSQQCELLGAIVVFWVLCLSGWNWLFHKPFANAAGVFVAGAADVAGAVGASDLLTSGFSADTAGVVAGNPVYGCGGVGGTGISSRAGAVSSVAGRAGGAGPGSCVIGGVAGPRLKIVLIRSNTGLGDDCGRHISNFAGMVSVIYCGNGGNFGRVESCDSGCGYGIVHVIAVSVSFDENVAGSDILKGYFSSRVGVSGTKDGVAYEACETSAGDEGATAPSFCCNLFFFNSQHGCAGCSRSVGFAIPFCAVRILFQHVLNNCEDVCFCDSFAVG